jgi:hypothetical protein
MTQKQFAALVREAENTNVGEKFNEISGLAADAIHASNSPVISKLGAIALIKWQALRWDGAWDDEALCETQAWFRKVQVV